MSFTYLILLSVSLAMDAFAVSISAGITLQKSLKKEALRLAFAFGFFQALMPTVGFFIATSFYSYISSYSHWVAFVLLAFIGIKMILESGEKKEKCECGAVSYAVSNKKLLLLAVATSIDAMAAGISLTVLSKHILLPALTIGVVTFCFSFVGVIFGKKLGCKFGNKTVVIGGIILILIGLKIVVKDFAQIF